MKGLTGSNEKPGVCSENECEDPLSLPVEEKCDGWPGFAEKERGKERKPEESNGRLGVRKRKQLQPKDRLVQKWLGIFPSLSRPLAKQSDDQGHQINQQSSFGYFPRPFAALRPLRTCLLASVSFQLELAGSHYGGDFDTASDSLTQDCYSQNPDRVSGWSFALSICPETLILI
jgi:hypothetical protein